MDNETEPERLAAALVGEADRSRGGILVTERSSAFRPVFASEGAAELFGCARDDLMRSDVTAWLEPRAADALRSALDDTDRSSSVVRSLEVSLRGGDRSAQDLRFQIVSVDVAGSRWLVWFIDEAGREDPEEQLRHVVETIPEAIYITDGTTLFYANPACASLFGFESAKMVGGSDCTDLVEPEDVAAFVEHLGAAKRAGAALGEFRMRALTGRRFVLEVQSIGIDYRARRMVLSFGQEVTRRKQLETELMQADRLAVLGTLAGSMAHAINNPLSYVMLNLEHLGRRLPELSEHPDVAPELGIRLREAHDGVDRIAKVVRQMRLLSKMREDGVDAVDLVGVIESVLGLVGNEIRHRGQLETRYGPTPLVLGNRGRLEHALLNLVLFAARSLPEERERPGCLAVETGTDAGGRAFARISDNGPGLDSRGRSSLFEPFGTPDDGGLGLTVCHDLVRSMSGDIEIESEPGRGTRFVVRLPAAREEAAHGPPSEHSEPLQSAGRSVSARVLVIDDDVKVADSLRVMLQEQHDVVSEQSGQDGLRRLLKDEAFDIVFCDLVMPDLGGIDIYYALQLNKPGVERKLVFMTGGVFTRDAESFLAQVENPSVEKPFSLQQVEALVHRAVRNRELGGR